MTVNIPLEELKSDGWIPKGKVAFVNGINRERSAYARANAVFISEYAAKDAQELAKQMNEVTKKLDPFREKLRVKHAGAPLRYKQEYMAKVNEVLEPLRAAYFKRILSRPKTDESSYRPDISIIIPDPENWGRGSYITRDGKVHHIA